LNPGTSDALLVSTHVYNVRTDGMLGDTVNTGAVTGSLSEAPLPVFYNTTIFNDMFQQIVWGDSLAFTVCLCGPGIGGASITGTTFSVSLHAPDGITPLLSSSDDGSMLHIDVNPPLGTVTTTVFPDGNGKKSSGCVGVSRASHGGEGGVRGGAAGVRLADAA
jgi:hypothetical protein